MPTGHHREVPPVTITLEADELELKRMEGRFATERGATDTELEELAGADSWHRCASYI